MAALVPTTDRQIVFLHDMDDGSFTQDGDLVSVKQTVVTTNPDGSLLITNPDGTTATAGAPTVDTNTIMTGATLDPATKMVTYTFTDKDGGALPPVVLDLSPFDTDTDTYNTFTSNPDGTISAQRVDKDGNNVGAAATLGVANTFMRPNAPTTDAVTGAITTVFDLVDEAGTVVTAAYWTHVSSPTIVWRAAFWQRGCTVISGQAQINETTGDTITTRVTLDPDGTLAAGDPIDPALTEIDPTQFPNNIPPCAQDDFDHTLKVAQSKTIDVGANDTLCDTAATKTYTESNVVNATVVNNGDGTFDVTPNAGACGDEWSFDYEVSCPAGTATATVSGEIIDGLTTFDLNVENATGTLTINRIDLSSGGTYDVTWPDGVVTTGHASGGPASHDLGAASFTGVVTVEHSSCGVVTRLRAVDNDSWVVNNANVSSLTSLTSLSLGNTGSNLTDASISLLTDLTLLSLYDTGSNLTDASISLLADLTYLDLGNTASNLTDASISLRTDLTHLSLYSTTTNLTDASISLLTDLTYLSMYSTDSDLTDASISLLTNLTYLSLYNTDSNLTDASISLLTDLTSLSLGNTDSNLTDASISLRTDLTLLSLYGTDSNLTDASVSLLTNLTYLDLDNTDSNLTDASISLLTSLTYLSLYNTTSLVTAGANATGLRTLYLRSTTLSQAQVDAHLAWFVANGPTVGRLDLRNTATPSAAGLADQSTLETAGYRNNVNGLPIV